MLINLRYRIASTIILDIMETKKNTFSKNILTTKDPKESQKLFALIVKTYEYL